MATHLFGAALPQATCAPTPECEGLVPEVRSTIRLRSSDVLSEVEVDHRAIASMAVADMVVAELVEVRL